MTQRSLVVTVEAVTPVFLGGADPRGAPELRPPAFRGAMRYWLRAALGGVIGDANLHALHALETAVFGSTEAASPISLRLGPLDGQLQTSTEKILPHKEGREAGSRQAFKAGQRFQLALSTPRRAEQAVWDAAVASLRLAVTFGGIGLRSRRGYGTLRIVESSSPEQLPVSPSRLGEWQQYAERSATQAIIACRGVARFGNISVIPHLLNGPSAFPSANRMGLIRLHDLKADSAMDAVKKFMGSVPRNQAFGGIQPRQASPLWVRPVQTENGWGLLFLVLASKLAAGTNYSSIRTFLDQHFPGRDLQVKGWNA